MCVYIYIYGARGLAWTPSPPGARTIHDIGPAAQHLVSPDGSLLHLNAKHSLQAGAALLGPHKDKDPTNHDFWYPPILGLSFGLLVGVMTSSFGFKLRAEALAS